MFRIFNKVIWQTPVGSSYYPIFNKDWRYYYVGLHYNLRSDNLFYKEHNLPLFEGTEKEYARFRRRNHKNKILKIKYFLDGFRRYKDY